MKTLRKRFILFAMSAVTALLVVLVGAINGLSWMLFEGQSDMVMNTLVGADGIFMQMDFERQPPFMPPLDMDRMRSARFFMVRTDETGQILEVNTDQISSIDKAQAKAYAKAVQERGLLSGKMGEYKFAVKELGEERLIFFMDNSGQRNIFFTVLFVSSVIAVICWLTVLLFVILLSGKAVRPIAAGMEKQKQFITNAGHELKTPLAVIQSNNDAMMLIHGENKYNTNIRSQIKRLNVLMNNLLTLAKLDEEVKLPTESVPVSEQVTELLPAYKDAAESRNITFTAQIGPEIRMQTNRDLFTQLVTVLLDNVVKYTPDGGTIVLTLKKEKNHIVLEEENTCPASHDPNPERLFERFYRGDDARTQDSTSSGYGIGLSAARAIAETFGGKLTAEYPSAEKIRFTARF